MRAAQPVWTARKEFNEALGMLAAPANTPQIKDSLELVKQQWFFFENASARKPVATNVRKRPWRRPVSVFLKKWKASWSLREAAK
jgi:hypothetical protein